MKRVQQKEIVLENAKALFLWPRAEEKKIVNTTITITSPWNLITLLKMKTLKSKIKTRISLETRYYLQNKNNTFADHSPRSSAPKKWKHSHTKNHYFIHKTTASIKIYKHFGQYSCSTIKVSERGSFSSPRNPEVWKNRTFNASML